MIQTSASVLSADLANLAQDTRDMLNAGADMVHFDVMDGHFVPNLSYGAPVLSCLKKAVPDTFYDVHLMITDPAKYAPDFAKAGADLITFHYEAVPEAVEETIRTIHALGCKAGISVKPGTPAEEVFPYLKEVELVLVMSVEPGFGGQKFMPAALQKLSALREECASQGVSPWLEVDGGVDGVTGPQCTAAGANLLVAGSYFFKAADRPAAVLSVKGE